MKQPARVSWPPLHKRGADNAAEIFITVSISHALFAPHLSDGWEIGWTQARAGESKSGGGFVGQGK